MHELGIMNDVLATALRVVETNNGKKVTKITLKVGVLSGILPNYMQSFFDLISKGTAAEGSKLVIENEPAVFQCADCGEQSTFESFGSDFVCLHCGGTSIRLLSGKSFQIVSVAII
ncbi:MAG: hydrogenase maturation nickel metallochaperone HypA [Oscillospiraceae bacterium]